MITLQQLAALIILAACVFVLTRCADPLCGYHGQGCGYIDSNSRNMATMSADQIDREAKRKGGGYILP